MDISLCNSHRYAFKPYYITTFIVLISPQSTHVLKDSLKDTIFLNNAFFSAYQQSHYPWHVQIPAPMGSRGRTESMCGRPLLGVCTVKASRVPQSDPT
jgi:hypothetical protein